MISATTPDQKLLEDLLTRTALKDQNAFNRLYEKTAPQVLGFLIRMLGNKMQAEDALQDTFLKVWSSAKQYRTGKGLVMSWMYTIARYRAIDIIRADKRRHLTLDEHQQESDAAYEEDPGESDEAINSCLEQLPGVQRQGIVEAFYKGWTYQELATRFAVPIGTMKTRIRRGLMRLKECLET